MVDTVPQIEAELGRLNRDYNVVRSKYEQLLVQLETASLDEVVEAKIDEVLFRVIEPPFADFQPVGPMRNVYLIGVLLVAVGLGIAVCFS